MKKKNIFILSLLASACVTSVFAAKSIDVKHESATFLKSFSSANQIALKEISRSTDFNQTTHVRLQETYAEIPVWGGDIIAHTTKDGKSSLNGSLFGGLNKDLGKMPAQQFETALQHAVQSFQQKNRKHEPCL